MAKNKRPKRPTSKTARQVRKSARRSRLRIGIKKIEMKKVVSQRGRTHPMEAPVPGMPETAQTLLMASTVIAKFRYDLKSKTLRIWFLSRHIYDYYNVPESVVLILAQAQSKGRFFYYNIRTEYNFSRKR